MSTNPFDDRRPSRSRTSRPRVRTTDNDAEPAIWAARHVEWPIPTALSLSNYQKLQRASKQAASQMGIDETAQEIAGTEEEKAEASYFSGFMSRVLNPTNADEDAKEEEPSSSPSGSRPLRSPRPRCVATANSWMVAALECPGTGGPPLRLVSRWNVRRMGGVDQWMALPPPVSGGDGRVQHVFVDPTGCHTLISAKNGEVYYHHSSLKAIQKLAGFGRNADGGWSKDMTGVTASSQAHRKSSAVNVQSGMSVGSYVTAVAWDRERGTEGSTKKILLGTNTGEIYEYALVSPNTNEDQEDTYAKPVLLHQLNSDASVAGLAFERLRTGLLVLVSTSGRNKRTRFYTFYSAHSSSFRMVMADESHASLVELPGSLDFADLRICNDQICLRTATGIYYGTIDKAQSGPAFAGGSIIMDSGILPYGEGKGSIPVSLALTPHHIITLSENNEVRFLNRVAQKVIQKEKVDWAVPSSSSNLDESHMALAELMMDVRRPDQVWLRRARSLVHISSSQEDRDVWKYTLFKCLEMPVGRRRSNTDTGVMTEEEKAQEALFGQAKSLCTHPSQKAVLTAVRAEYHLSQGRAELGAKYLAQCPPVLKPFADTAVRLALPMLNIDDSGSYGGSALARESLKSNAPLITYLTDKMRVSKNSDDKMTCTMIGAWLTELHLHDRDVSQDSKSSLMQFLTSNVHNMDAKTIIKILSSHDVSALECAGYANISGDIETAVNAALRVESDTNDSVVDALRILNDAPFERAEPLYYKHATTLLARAPVLAGKSFLSRYTHGLSPNRLLPSIMFYERLREDRAKHLKAAKSLHSPRGRNGVGDSKNTESFDTGRNMFGGGVEVQIMPGIAGLGSFVENGEVSAQYLEGVIKLGCRSSAIYSFLISIYVKLENEDPLFKFLSAHVPAASMASDASRKAGLSSVDESLAGPLDMSYALRTILATGRHFRSAIKLYMGFGMRQQAVELALKVDPSLARELAQESVELEERKRLWLMIAKNAASEGMNSAEVDVVSKVVSVLKDCGPDVLSIEDVLPFLPDFAQIDQIKDEICEALTSYSSKIEGFLKEMNESDQACDSLRQEISRLRTHRMEMKSDARCAYTNRAVLSSGEPFYVFPSGYVVLESALKREVLPYLNERQRRRVAEIEQEFKILSKQNRQRDQKIDSLQAELDGLIAAECPLTGSIMVDSIAHGFSDDDLDDVSFLQTPSKVGDSNHNTATV